MEFASFTFAEGDRVQDQSTGIVGVVREIFQRVGDEEGEDADFVLGIEDSDGQSHLVRAAGAKRV